MANEQHLIIVTHLEEPKLYLCQNTAFEPLIQVLRVDPFFHEKRANVYVFQPETNPLLQPNLKSLPNLIRLQRVGTNETRHLASIYFQEALHAASMSGERGQNALLMEFINIASKLITNPPTIEEDNVVDDLADNWEKGDFSGG